MVYLIATSSWIPGLGDFITVVLKLLQSFCRFHVFFMFIKIAAILLFLSCYLFILETSCEKLVKINADVSFWVIVRSRESHLLSLIEPTAFSSEVSNWLVTINLWNGAVWEVHKHASSASLLKASRCANLALTDPVPLSRVALREVYYLVIREFFRLFRGSWLHTSSSHAPVAVSQTL